MYASWRAVIVNKKWHWHFNIYVLNQIIANIFKISKQATIYILLNATVSAGSLCFCIMYSSTYILAYLTALAISYRGDAHTHILWLLFWRACLQWIEVHNPCVTLLPWPQTINLTIDCFSCINTFMWEINGINIIILCSHTWWGCTFIFILYFCNNVSLLFEDNTF